MPALFSVLGCRRKSAVYFGVDEKFSPGELILLKNADVIQFKCSVGILAELEMELINPPWCLPAELELLAPGRHSGAAPCRAPAPAPLPAWGGTHPPSAWG